MKYLKNKKIASLGNMGSSKYTSRIELIKLCQENNYQYYIFGKLETKINEFYQRENVEFVPINTSRNNINPFKELKTILSVKKQIKKNNIGNVIIYGVKNHIAMTVGAKFGGANKILCVVNGSGNLFQIKGFKGNILRFISFIGMRYAYKLASKIAFQNKDDLNLFLENKLISNIDKTFIVNGSGVNLDKFKFTELPKENRFLFLSRITPSKGIIEYIEAAKIVKKEYPNVIFDVVGPIDNTVEGSCKDLLDHAIKDNIVNYYGPTDDVLSFIQKCRCFVFPSYYKEGTPRVVLEAMSCGRPIITTDNSGCRETVIDGYNGYLIEIKNSIMLSEKIKHLIEHSEICNNMAINSRKYAEDKFNVHTVNKKLLETFVDK